MADKTRKEQINEQSKGKLLRNRLTLIKRRHRELILGVRGRPLEDFDDGMDYELDEYYDNYEPVEEEVEVIESSELDLF